jgi:ATP-dependent helicase/nuclease subunit A
MVWAGRKADDPPAVATARAAMIQDTEDEYRRLLYVAMTRAADRLIVGGCMPGNRNEVRPLSWYDLIAKGLEGSGLQMRTVPPPDGLVKRYCKLDEATPQAGTTEAAPAAPPLALPSWLRTAAGPLARPDQVLRPSDSDDGAARCIRTGESAEQRARALLRGVLVHRLLQSLPDVAADRRREAAARYLARNAEGWNEAEREALAARVLTLIEDARFAALFAPGSRAEVPIVGRLMRHGQPVLVSGQIDRLVVTPAEVLIVDYKTNHAPPLTEAEAPAGYLRQLALYRAVLQKLYPTRPVRAALVWTEATEMMEISAPALDAQLTTFMLP